jgi:hypothetical protein
LQRVREAGDVVTRLSSRTREDCVALSTGRVRIFEECARVIDACARVLETWGTSREHVRTYR